MVSLWCPYCEGRHKEATVKETIRQIKQRPQNEERGDEHHMIFLAVVMQRLPYLRQQRCLLFEFTHQPRFHSIACVALALQLVAIFVGNKISIPWYLIIIPTNRLPK